MFPSIDLPRCRMTHLVPFSTPDTHPVPSQGIRPLVIYCHSLSHAHALIRMSRSYIHALNYDLVDCARRPPLRHYTPNSRDHMRATTRPHFSCRCGYTRTPTTQGQPSQHCDCRRYISLVARPACISTRYAPAHLTWHLTMRHLTDPLSSSSRSRRFVYFFLLDK